MITDRGATVVVYGEIINLWVRLPKDKKLRGRTNWSGRIIVTCICIDRFRGIFEQDQNLFLRRMNSKVDRISMLPMNSKVESTRYTTNSHLINPAFRQRDQLVA